MTFKLTELTPDRAKPIEKYYFSIGGTNRFWAYTTDTQPDGIYIPEAISRSNVKRTLSEPSSDMTIEVGDENPFALELMAGLTSRPVSVTVQQVHRGDGEHVNVFTGYVAGVSFEGPKATITCLPRLAVASRRRVPWQTYQAGCNWQWSSVGCGVDKADFQRGPYTLVVNPPIMLDGLATASGLTLRIGGAHADGDLSNGWVSRVSDGDTRFIEQNVGGLLTLQSPFPNYAAGETFVVYPGCRRTEEDCEKRFNNLVHFLGWPRLPTLNPFDRSAFYLAGAAAAVPTAPPTTTVNDPTTGTGYALDLSTQKVRLDVGYNEIVLQVSVTILFTTDGFVRANGTAFPVNFISPHPCPASVTAGLDVYVDSAGLPSGGKTGFDQWLPLSSNTSSTFGFSLSSGTTNDGYDRLAIYRIYKIAVKIRNRSTGVISAQGFLDVGVVGYVRSARGAGAGPRPPSGW